MKIAVYPGTIKSKAEVEKNVFEYAENFAIALGLKSEDFCMFPKSKRIAIARWSLDDAVVVFNNRPGSIKVEIQLGNNYASVTLAPGEEPTEEFTRYGTNKIKYDNCLRPFSSSSRGISGLRLVNSMWDRLEKLSNPASFDFIYEDPNLKKEQ